MIIAKPKPPAPGEEGLITRVECRVSRWFGVKFLTAIPLYVLLMVVAMPLSNWMMESFGLSHRSIWFFIAFVILWLAIERLYNVFWMRTVAIYDRGDQVEIQVNDRLYQFPWSALRKVRTYRIPTRSGGTHSINLVLKFEGRTFRLSSSDGHLFELQKLGDILRQRLDVKGLA